MKPEPEIGGGGMLRRLASLEKSNEEIKVELHDELREVKAELASLREAVNTVGNRILYAVAIGALGFAFGVLRLVG